MTLVPPRSSSIPCATHGIGTFTIDGAVGGTATKHSVGRMAAASASHCLGAPRVSF